MRVDLDCTYRGALVALRPLTARGVAFVRWHLKHEPFQWVQGELVVEGSGPLVAALERGLVLRDVGTGRVARP